MQETFYDILTKHFFGQTTPEEEKVIDQYKIDHQQEYARLKKLFTHGEMSLKEFNSSTAWQNVMAKYNSHNTNRTKMITMYAVARVAAGIALLVGLLTGAYLLFNAPSAVAHTQLIATGTQQEKVLLSDGSVVWLNDNAQLTYPDRFESDARKVKLTGEAFFEVTRNIDSPFIICAPSADIKVLGTSFNVNAQSDITEVAVATGKVQVNSNSNANKVVVNAGFSARASKREVKSYANSSNYQAWRTGIFQFKKTSLYDVVADLNTYYPKKIQIASNRKLECDLTARFDRAPLHEVIEVLRFTCPVSIEESTEGVYIIR
jgi:transmembrane sensor